MEMNKYLLAALYVVAGCVVTMPSGGRNESVPVGRDSYRLLISSTQKIITVALEKKSVDELAFDVFGAQSLTTISDLIADRFSCSWVALPGFKSPDVAANPIRAPGKALQFKV
ncbi:hypothetical protein [Gabonibacter massiliensis]|uniref:hypothetical protein n=1 Tax=Gabonibacter massiliensis TaxID=1720195 RepID=UPI0011C6F599|nr:hypothetical protein [Gabonibacter massiliensis]